MAAIGGLGHSNDGVFADFFAGKGIADRFVRTGGETRTNIKIADRASGETTDVNLPGLTVSDDVFDAVRATLTRCVAPCRPVVLAGSPESPPEPPGRRSPATSPAATPASCSTRWARRSPPPSPAASRSTR